MADVQAHFHPGFLARAGDQAELRLSRCPDGAYEVRVVELDWFLNDTGDRVFEGDGRSDELARFAVTVARRRFSSPRLLSRTENPGGTRVSLGFQGASERFELRVSPDRDDRWEEWNPTAQLLRLARHYRLLQPPIESFSALEGLAREARKTPRELLAERVPAAQRERYESLVRGVDDRKAARYLELGAELLRDGETLYTTETACSVPMPAEVLAVMFFAPVREGERTLLPLRRAADLRIAAFGERVELLSCDAQGHLRGADGRRYPWSAGETRRLLPLEAEYPADALAAASALAAEVALRAEPAADFLREHGQPCVPEIDRAAVSERMREVSAALRERARASAELAQSRAALERLEGFQRQCAHAYEGRAWYTRRGATFEQRFAELVLVRDTQIYVGSGLRYEPSRGDWVVDRELFRVRAHQLHGYRFDPKEPRVLEGFRSRDRRAREILALRAQITRQEEAVQREQDRRVALEVELRALQEQDLQTHGEALYAFLPARLPWRLVALAGVEKQPAAELQLLPAELETTPLAGSLQLEEESGPRALESDAEGWLLEPAGASPGNRHRALPRATARLLLRRGPLAFRADAVYLPTPAHEELRGLRFGFPGQAYGASLAEWEGLAPRLAAVGAPRALGLADLCALSGPLPALRQSWLDACLEDADPRDPDELVAALHQVVALVGSDDAPAAVGKVFAALVERAVRRARPEDGAALVPLALFLRGLGSHPVLPVVAEAVGDVALHERLGKPSLRAFALYLADCCARDQALAVMRAFLRCMPAYRDDFFVRRELCIALTRVVLRFWEHGSGPSWVVLVETFVHLQNTDEDTLAVLEICDWLLLGARHLEEDERESLFDLLRDATTSSKGHSIPELLAAMLAAPLTAEETAAKPEWSTSPETNRRFAGIALALDEACNGHWMQRGVEGMDFFLEHHCAGSRLAAHLHRHGARLGPVLVEASWALAGVRLAPGDLACAALLHSDTPSVLQAVFAAADDAGGAGEWSVSDYDTITRLRKEAVTTARQIVSLGPRGAPLLEPVRDLANLEGPALEQAESALIRALDTLPEEDAELLSSSVRLKALLIHRRVAREHDGKLYVLSPLAVAAPVVDLTLGFAVLCGRDRVTRQGTGGAVVPRLRPHGDGKIFEARHLASGTVVAADADRLDLKLTRAGAWTVWAGVQYEVAGSVSWLEVTIDVAAQAPALENTVEAKAARIQQLADGYTDANAEGAIYRIIRGFGADAEGLSKLRSLVSMRSVFSELGQWRCADLFREVEGFHAPTRRFAEELFFSPAGMMAVPVMAAEHVGGLKSESRARYKEQLAAIVAGPGEGPKVEFIPVLWFSYEAMAPIPIVLHGGRTGTGYRIIDPFLPKMRTYEGRDKAAAFRDYLEHAPLPPGKLFYARATSEGLPESRRDSLDPDTIYSRDFWESPFSLTDIIAGGIGLAALVLLVLPEPAASKTAAVALFSAASGLAAGTMVYFACRGAYGFYEKLSHGQPLSDPEVILDLIDVLTAFAAGGTAYFSRAARIARTAENIAGVRRAVYAKLFLTVTGVSLDAVELATIVRNLPDNPSALHLGQAVLSAGVILLSNRSTAQELRGLWQGTRLQVVAFDRARAEAYTLHANGSPEAAQRRVAGVMEELLGSAFEVELAVRPGARELHPSRLRGSTSRGRSPAGELTWLSTRLDTQAGRQDVSSFAVARTEAGLAVEACGFGKPGQTDRRRGRSALELHLLEWQQVANRTGRPVEFRTKGQTNEGRTLLEALRFEVAADPRVQDGFVGTKRLSPQVEGVRSARPRAPDGPIRPGELAGLRAELTARETDLGRRGTALDLGEDELRPFLQWRQQHHADSHIPSWELYHYYRSTDAALERVPARLRRELGRIRASGNATAAQRRSAILLQLGRIPGVTDPAQALDDILTWLRRDAEIVHYWKPDFPIRRGTGEAQQVVHYIVDSVTGSPRLMNRFETGVTLAAGGADGVKNRLETEERLFGLPSRETLPSERPVYALFRTGAEDRLNYGRCFFVLRRDVDLRATFTNNDSFLLHDRTKVGTIDALENVLYEMDPRLLENLLRASRGEALAHSAAALRAGDASASYLEAQVHGPIEFNRDIEAMVADIGYRDGSERTFTSAVDNTTVDIAERMRAMSRERRIPLYWLDPSTQARTLDPQGFQP